MITHVREYDFVRSDGTTVHIGPDDIRKDDEHRHKYNDAMAEFLDTLGLDYADEDCGDVEWDVFVMRFGKRLLMTNDRGFVYCEKRRNEDEAKAIFVSIEKDYYKWCEECDEEEQ